MIRPTYLDEHRSTRPAFTRPTRPAAVDTAAGAAPPTARATGLRIDPDGRLSEVFLPRTNTSAAMPAHVSIDTGAQVDIEVGVEVLDADLAVWFAEDGAFNGVHNPAASVVMAMFGRPGPVYGPVVFTGWVQPRPGLPTGTVSDVSVAATILLAGVAPTCDPGAATVDRATEFARLDVEIVPAPRPASDPASARSIEPAVSYDAQAHTVTVDGDVARCTECDEPAAGLGHPEHQPHVLAQR